MQQHEAASGNEVVERGRRAIDFDAQNGTDKQWSELLAFAIDATDLIERLTGAGSDARGIEELKKRLHRLATRLNTTGPTRVSRSGAGHELIAIAEGVAHRLTAQPAEGELRAAEAEALYDRIHLEELSKGGRMGEIRLRVVRRFVAEELAGIDRAHSGGEG